jgi:hypothetical protein
MRRRKSDAVDKLRSLIARFLNDQDRSMAFVNEIERLVLEEFSGADFYDDLSLALSLYSPGSPEDGLVSEDELSKELRWVLGQLEFLKSSLPKSKSG